MQAGFQPDLSPKNAARRWIDPVTATRLLAFFFEVLVLGVMDAGGGAERFAVIVDR